MKNINNYITEAKYKNVKYYDYNTNKWLKTKVEFPCYSAFYIKVGHKGESETMYTITGNRGHIGRAYFQTIDEVKEAINKHLELNPKQQCVIVKQFEEDEGKIVMFINSKGKEIDLNEDK